MNAEMIGLLLRQFGITDEQAKSFLALIGNAGATVQNFDAKLNGIAEAQARIELQLQKLNGGNDATN